MNAFMMIITMLLSIVFWRQLVAFLAATFIVLVVCGFVFVLEALSAGTGGFTG